MYCQQCQRILATPDRLCDSCNKKLSEKQGEPHEPSGNDLWLNLEPVTLGYITHIRVPSLTVVAFLFTMSVTFTAILVTVMIRTGLFS